MYRLISCVVFAIGIILIIISLCSFQSKASKANCAAQKTLVCIGVICIIASFVPRDSSYRSNLPEDVFKQISSNEILHIIRGDESCMIVSVDHTGNHEYIILTQDERGYKIPGMNAAKKVFSSEPGFSTFDIFQASGTSDYYISGIGVYTEDSLTVQDSLGSQFYIIGDPLIEEGIKTETAIYLYYAYLDSFEKEYSIIINGQTFYVGEAK